MMIRRSRQSPGTLWASIFLFATLVLATGTIVDKTNFSSASPIPLAKAGSSVTIWLNGDAVGAIPGWNDSSPGPRLILDSGVTVHLLLNATDGLTHDWFIDTKNDLSPDPSGITSPDFSHSTTNVLNFTFTPIVGQNVPLAGNWTYRCMYHPNVMFGTITINGSGSPQPTATSTPSLYIIAATAAVAVVIAIVVSLLIIRMRKKRSS